MSRFDDFLKFQLFSHIVLGDNSEDNFFHEPENEFEKFARESDFDDDWDDDDFENDGWDE